MNTSDYCDICDATLTQAEIDRDGRCLCDACAADTDEANP